VFREGRLLAVLSCLSDIHGELAGQWFVEMDFACLADPRQRMFASLDAAKAHLEAR
jgi:hypothetical protein